MSSVFYPIGLIQSLQPLRTSRVLSDAFEDGSTNTRRGWSDRFFKRQFHLTHSPLTFAEWRYLRAFYAARNGRFDSFWFRDNVYREGNAQVRFTMDLAPTFTGSARNVDVTFDEIAAVRALPEIDEVVTAAGSSPLVWYDPNRELYYSHLGADFYPESDRLYDAILVPEYLALWQAQSLNLTNLLGQYQAYHFNGTRWAKTTSNISELVGAQPAITVFCIARHSTVAANQVVVTAGAPGSTHAHGLQIRSDNNYYIHQGQFTGGISFANSPADTWRSFGITGDASANFAHFYAAGANLGTLSSTRAMSAAPFAIGADTDGSNIANPSNVLTNCDVAEVMLFSSTLSLAQYKNLHNLFAPLYGYATV